MIQLTQKGNRNHREPVRLNIFSLTAEGDEISAEAAGILVRANGRAYRQHYCFHLKAYNGKLVDSPVYRDTLHQFDVTLDPSDGGPVTVRMSSVQLRSVS